MGTESRSVVVQGVQGLGRVEWSLPRGVRVLWRLTGKFGALNVLMVLQLYTFFQMLTTLYTLNMCRLYNNHTSESCAFLKAVKEELKLGGSVVLWKELKQHNRSQDQSQVCAPTY